MKKISNTFYDYSSARSIHIDFHNSPKLPHIGADFNPHQFTKTLVDAHVNRVAIFAKCCHGFCYYPTKEGIVHPELSRPDLLGEMLESLKKANIHASIYITVGFDEEGARLHPEWRQMTYEGQFVDEIGKGRVGDWKFMNFTHPDYIEHIGRLSQEIVAKYDFHGLFYDILFYDERACWSPSSIQFRDKHKLMERTIEHQKRFEVLAQRNFMNEMERMIGKKYRKLSVFYNSTNHAHIQSEWSFEHRRKHQSHFEIESLASGAWGYHHFPRMARQVNQWGSGWMAQTGRFQKMWGDFGGIKPLPALEYECFRCQALGGGNVVGDQMLPNGGLDQGAYRLIGKVFEQCEKAASFYNGSVPLREIGILNATHLKKSSMETAHSEEGVVMMCEESHYESAVLNDGSDLSHFKVLVLPDSNMITPRLGKKLEIFYRAGGKLVLSYRSGFNEKGEWALKFLPLKFEVKSLEETPSYWRVRKNFLKMYHGDDRIIYQTGLQVTGGKGTTILADRVLPYFKRSDLTFCSHFQSPARPQKEPFAAIIAGDRFVYFADPIFHEYRKSGNLIVRDGWREIMQSLAGDAMVGEGLPSTVLSTTRLVQGTPKEKELRITLLHYIPVRKSLEIDIIEERMNFSGQYLKIPTRYQNAIVYPTGESLIKTKVGFALPSQSGRLLIRAFES